MKLKEPRLVRTAITRDEMWLLTLARVLRKIGNAGGGWRERRLYAERALLMCGDRVKIIDRAD